MRSFLTVLKTGAGNLWPGLQSFIQRFELNDRWLILALVLGLILGVQGFTWGRYDCLNKDKMAFQNIFAKNRLPFQPSRYVKPPFYTYACHFAARVPAMTISSLFFWKKSPERYAIFLKIRLWLARTLNLCMFACCTIAIFIIAREFFSKSAARVAALLFATSAGFIPYQIFLTTDLAVVFMMLASFLYALKIINNPSIFNSMMAGLLAGFATATKYNGLAVAIALPLAHILAGHSGNLLFKAIRRPSAWICGICVPLGFILGNPYCLLDWHQFKKDFLYNYTVTPVYNGATSGTGYGKFFESFYEIYGLPASIIIFISCIIGFLAIILNSKKTQVWKVWILSFAVLAFYTYKIGSFPRMETRFVLPAAPFLLLLASAGFVQLLKVKHLFLPIVVALVVYNLICGYFIGQIFINDPRNYVSTFTDQRLQHGGIVEWSKSLPKLEGLPEKLKIYEIEGGLERTAMFQRMFAENAEILDTVNKKESQRTPDWFSVENRKLRNPDYVMWCSIELEDIVKNHYEALFKESSGYRVIYDATTKEIPSWVYPQRTEFTRNRTTIWEKIPSV